MKKYIVRLTAPERASLLSLTTRGESKARKRKRSLVLLSADEGAADAEIARQVRTSVSTVERVRQRFVEEGLEAALSERPRPGKARNWRGGREAHVLALACRTPPAGRKRWTLQWLADRLVELGVVETISDETVRRTLKRGS